MELAHIIPYFYTGAGFVGIFMVCIILRIFVPGWVDKERREEIKELKETVKVERSRADAAVAAASATRDILLSLKGRGPDWHAETP